MPGEAGSPYWAAVDFDSEGDEAQPPSGLNHRVYIDPWDNEAYGLIQQDAPESSQGENFNSFAGEPVSASFYYVPTKNYDSGEEPQPRRISPAKAIVAPDYAIYGRKLSRAIIPDYHPDVTVYSDTPMRDRRRSVYIEEPVYAPHPVLYEPLYGYIPPPPGYLPTPPRSRMSLPHHPEYMMAALAYNKHRRHSRFTDAYEHFAYESLSPEYEDWARPFPKTAPDNFHLSRYGHLQIDYSCSWNSLDRLIRNS
ncbi:uncharacterized protein LOC113237253 isoform X2 [Hyposmocoma kahamanoa]|uniref:uncharacterized protein LOC113237253 isoform X2 n=1 Tax=Hyposmocoma kahamanoa TaxID=1477025 RepID=UPI000E6D63CA|nr:uncharacterized protein LOC113237253 isoform X2 [Hyposmocoma kahamanoa]